MRSGAAPLSSPMAWVGACRALGCNAHMGCLTKIIMIIIIVIINVTTPKTRGLTRLYHTWYPGRRARIA
jgi:hypothetical protein